MTDVQSATPEERFRLERLGLEQLVRELLPALFEAHWTHDGPFSTCRVSLRFVSTFDVRLDTPSSIVHELVDIARCHLLRAVARAAGEGQL